MPKIEQPVGTMLPADETPNTDTRSFGPASIPIHLLATAPVGMPSHSVDGFVREFLHELNTNQGVTLSRSSVNDQYLALASTVKNYLMARWLETGRKTREAKAKTIGYLSAEYLLGRQLGNALLATDLSEIARQGLELCGIDIATLKVTDTYAVPGGPDCMDISSDGKTLYVTSRWAKKLSVVDLVNNKIARQVNVGRSPHGVWTLDHAKP